MPKTKKSPQSPSAPAPALTPPGTTTPGGVVETPMTAPAPKKNDKLVRGGTSSGRPGQIVTNANRWRENYNPLRSLTMRRVVELFELAQRGDTAYLQWTFRFIERRYPTLAALITRCEEPMANFEWQIKVKADLPPGATEAMAEAQKKALQDAYESIDNLSDAIGHLAHADFRGYAHLQKHRTPDGEVYHLEHLHQWCICRDGLNGNWWWNPDSRSTSAPLQFLGKDFCIGGDTLPIEDFIIREVSRPIDEIALVNFVRHNLCEKDADGFIEIYGIPGGVVTMPSNVPPGQETTYEAAAQKVAEGGTGAIPAGSTYQANDGPRGVDPFTPRFKHLDEQLIMAGTGGKLTMLTESGSGTLAGSAHTDTFEEIAAGRAKKVSAVFQQQFDAEVLNREFPGQPHLVYFEFGPKDEEDVSALVEDVSKLATAGYKADAAWLSERTGYELEEKEEQPLPAPNMPANQPNQPPIPGKQQKQTIKNRDVVAQPGPSQQFEGAFGNDLSEALAPDLNILNKKLEALLSIDDKNLFRSRLAQLLQWIEHNEEHLTNNPHLEDALQRGLAAAFGNGIAANAHTT